MNLNSENTNNNFKNKNIKNDIENTTNNINNSFNNNNINKTINTVLCDSNQNNKNEDIYDINTYNYDLPENLIATNHILPRDNSKLLYYDFKKNKKEDLIFKNIINHFSKDDILVLNDTKVKKTFLKCEKMTGSKGTLSLVEKISNKKYKIALHQRNPKFGTVLLFENGQRAIITKADLLDFEIEFEENPNELIKNYATYTLPSYIKNENVNKELYQTIYSNSEKEDSLAAPTAGLHFTNELLNQLRAKGVIILFVTLNVGLGTFAALKVNDIRDHDIHCEDIEIEKDVADKINNRKGKLFLVGTTSLRTLESFTNKDGKVEYGQKSTKIFIYPGYNFNLKFDGLITNFHLPKSTLLMLVSALIGKNKIIELYNYAIEKNYRFYSLGDATFLDNLKL